MAITACFIALITTHLKKRIHTNTSFWAVTLSFWSNMRISRQNNSILAAFGRHRINFVDTLAFRHEFYHNP